jgi:hypothetical protein
MDRDTIELLVLSFVSVFAWCGLWEAYFWFRHRSSSDAETETNEREQDS